MVGGGGGGDQGLEGRGARQPSQRHFAGFGWRLRTQLAVGATDRLACRNTHTHSHDVSSVAIVGLFLEPNFYQIVSFPSGERKALVCLVQIRHNRFFIFYWTINKSEQHSMSKSIRLI